MSWGYYGWRPYVPLAERRAAAAREVAKLAKKTGRPASPVVLDGRAIAVTFWGKAWCDNLEAYSDFENRLPRGRSYVRNGSVVDLQIEPGKVTALVAGSELYRVAIKIKPLASSRWKSIQVDCAGKIDSLIELLQGRLSSAVMRIVTRPERGLFPAPKEIDLDCSCPDWADLCKHVAATLYGVGARLDRDPGLLFRLRGVDPADLITGPATAEAVKQATAEGAPAMTEAEAADVFGIELEPRSARPIAVDHSPTANVPVPADDIATPTPTPAPSSAPVPAQPNRRQRNARRKLSAAARARLASLAKLRWQRGKDASTRSRATVTEAPRKRQAERKISAAARARIAAAVRARWARLTMQRSACTGAVQPKVKFRAKAVTADSPTSQRLA